MAGSWQAGRKSPRLRVLVVVLGGTACAVAGAAAWRTASAPDAAAAPPRRHVIEIRGFAFEPAVLQVSPGDTVVWINGDVAPHTATASDRGWDTGNIAAGQSGMRVIAAEGDTAYFCLYHPTMKARLSVRRDARPPAGQTTGGGGPRISPPPSPPPQPPPICAVSRCAA